MRWQLGWKTYDTHGRSQKSDQTEARNNEEGPERTGKRKGRKGPERGPERDRKPKPGKDRNRIPGPGPEDRNRTGRGETAGPEKDRNTSNLVFGDLVLALAGAQRGNRSETSRFHKNLV